MKQLIVLAAVLLGCVTAGAQNRYYYGGDVSFTASSSGTRIVVYPEIGRRISDNLYFGIAAGGGYYHHGSVSDFSMGITPHLRAYWFAWERYGLSGDLHATYRATRRQGYEPLITTFETGIRPGVVIPVGNGASLTAQFGFFGYSRTDYGNQDIRSRWVARLEAHDILIGVLMNL